MTIPNPSDGLRQAKRKTGIWLDGTMTRRRFLPAYVVLVVALAGAFFLTANQGSHFDEAQIQDRVERCLIIVEQVDGLRYNLNEIYDVLGFLFDEIDQSVPGFDDSLVRLRVRTATGRSEIDERYPRRSLEDCLVGDR